MVQLYKASQSDPVYCPLFEEQLERQLIPRLARSVLINIQLSASNFRIPVEYGPADLVHDERRSSATSNARTSTIKWSLAISRRAASFAVCTTIPSSRTAANFRQLISCGPIT